MSIGKCHAHHITRCMMTVFYLTKLNWQRNFVIARRQLLSGWNLLRRTVPETFINIDKSIKIGQRTGLKVFLSPPLISSHDNESDSKFRCYFSVFS